MRLTADLIVGSPTFLNPLGDRELCLRGNKISVIENLGATQDGFDTLDLSDNEIQKLENFPLLRRLRTVFLHNNHISTVASKLGESLPKLETLLLTNNKIENLPDLEPLGELRSLKLLSLVNNPVTKIKNYRLYVIHLLPQLRLLDYAKIKASEKRQARAMFRGDDTAEQTKQPHAPRTFVPGQTAKSSNEVEAIKAAIGNVKSLEEVQRLERALQQGRLPKPGEDHMVSDNEKGAEDHMEQS